MSASCCDCGSVTCAACSSVGIPKTLTVTWSNSGKCAVYDGNSFTLTYNSGTGSWISGTITGADGCGYNITLICRSAIFNDFELIFYQGNTRFAVPTSCSPLSITFSISAHSTGGGCTTCQNGGVNFAITATVAP